MYSAGVNTDKALELLDFRSADELNFTALKKRYRTRAKQKHPDKKGGSREDFVELQKAYQHLKRLLEKTEDELALLRKAIIEEEMEIEEAELERRLKVVDKTELLAKFIESEKQVVQHKSILRKQADFLTQTQEVVEELIVEYRDKQGALRTELEGILGDLEKEYSPTAVQKIMFFLPRPNYNEFIDRKSSLMNTFQDLSFDLENKLSKEIVKIYGEALNKLNSTLEELELTYEA